MFPKLALIEIRRKRLDLMKTAFPLPFKETGSAPDIVEVTLLARAQFTLPAYFGKIKQSHTELLFLLLLLIFLSFSYFVFACTFFTLNFVFHKMQSKRSTSKIKIRERQKNEQQKEKKQLRVALFDLTEVRW